MLVVVNRLFVKEDQAEAFEQFILSRMSFVEDVEGLLDCSFERPESLENPYVLRTVWEDRSFLGAWMKSEKFQKAHEKFENKPDFYFKENEMTFGTVIGNLSDW